MERKLSFTYDVITDNNPNPGHDIEEFWQDQFMVVEFSIHFINFHTKQNLSDTFSYNYCFWSVY